MRRTLKDLLPLYSYPESYIFELSGFDSPEDGCFAPASESCRVQRSADELRLLFMGRNVPLTDSIHITIPMDAESLRAYRELASRLVIYRNPLTPPIDIPTVKCHSKMFDTLHATAIVQHLPEGRLLSEFVDGVSRGEVESLYIAISRLEQGMCERSISYGRLSPEMIIYGADGLLYPFELRGLRFCVDDSVIESECGELREWLQLRTDVEMICSEGLFQNPYMNSLSDINGGYLSCRHPHEERIAVESPTGWGFVDMENRVVIEPHYLWVSDFQEGRAEVSVGDDERYGLIDLYGNYVIEPMYDTIEYNPKDGTTQVELDGNKYIFDYSGNRR